MVLIQKIRNYFSEQPVEKAWLFGSYSRNEETPLSDIDILVSFTKNSEITLIKYAHMVNELKKLTGKKIDLVEKGQLKEFAKEMAEKEKILIYERGR